jgi:hypothetical protein
MMLNIPNKSFWRTAQSLPINGAKQVEAACAEAI